MAVNVADLRREFQASEILVTGASYPFSGACSRDWCDDTPCVSCFLSSLDSFGQKEAVRNEDDSAVVVATINPTGLTRYNLPGACSLTAQDMPWHEYICSGGKQWHGSPKNPGIGKNDDG